MNKEIELVIPLGNGDPRLDVPEDKLLINRLSAIKQQTMPIKLTLAIDSNFNSRKLEIAKQYADKIKYFGADSYFAPGGIWEKIYSCWEESDCNFLAWTGYDDVNSKDRFEKQLSKIKETGANSCVCENWAVDPGGTKMINNGNINFIQHIGSHMAFMGNFLLRKDAICNSGIAQYRKIWTYYWEGLEYAFILKTGKPCVSDGAFFYYSHPATIANTAQEYQDWVKQIRQRTNYWEADFMRDWSNVPFTRICQQVANEWINKYGK
jgi:hypothetical protein